MDYCYGMGRETKGIMTNLKRGLLTSIFWAD